MRKNKGRTLGTIGMAVLDAFLVPYTMALAVREPSFPPKEYLKVPSSQVTQYGRQNIEVTGVPKSVNYRPGLAGRGLEIELETGSGQLIRAESRILPASLTEARNARPVSYDVVRQIHHMLDGQITSGNPRPITLMGNYDGLDEFVRIHRIVIDGKPYSLFIPAPASAEKYM